jgi:hypothetical protein
MRIAALAFALVAFASAGLAVPLDPRQINNVCPIPNYTAPPNPQHMVAWQEAGVEWPSGSQVMLSRMMIRLASLNSNTRL